MVATETPSATKWPALEPGVSQLLLQAHDLVVVLPGDFGDIRVLDGVSFELAAGTVCDVIGPSGSGKTTLLRALAWLLPVGTGSLLLDGVSAGEIHPTAWRAAVALLPQKPVIVEGCVRDNLLRPWSLKVHHGHTAPDDSAMRAALDRVALDAALDRDAARLSVGQQARVALVRTLLTRPRVLLLDEPDAALDEVSAAAVGDLTREFAENGGAVVRVRHHRSDDIAHRRLRLAGGSLVDAEEVSS
jgi:putative ABC transport system ATP-binding protein